MTTRQTIRHGRRFSTQVPGTLSVASPPLLSRQP